MVKKKTILSRVVVAMIWPENSNNMNVTIVKSFRKHEFTMADLSLTRQS